jgi:hypothetical protein
MLHYSENILGYTQFSKKTSANAAITHDQMQQKQTVERSKNSKNKQSIPELQQNT